jgi:hypothetical protein
MKRDERGKKDLMDGGAAQPTTKLAMADGRKRVPWSDEEISILEKAKMCRNTHTHMHIYL